MTSSKDMTERKNKEIRKAIESGIPYDSPLLNRPFDKEVANKLFEDRNKLIENKQPTKAYEALINRYKNKKGFNIVDNTIDEIISDEIYEIREAVNNAINYGDSRVFRKLPEELKKHIEDYLIPSQEYFGERKRSIAGQPVYIIPETFSYCTKCGKYKEKDLFYFTNSDTCNGISHICKECSNNLFKEYIKKYKDIKECLILISQKLDLYVYEPVLTKYINYYNTPEGKEDIRNSLFLGKYIGDLGIQIHFNSGFEEYSFADSNFEGIPFKCVVNYAAVPPIYDDKLVPINDVESNDTEDSNSYLDDDKEMSQYHINKLEYKFGKYAPYELKWLEKRYIEWDEAYDISALNTKKLIVQMCCDELAIVRLREKGADVTKLWKGFMETMKNLNLTPKQQAKDAKSNGFSSLSEYIKEVEKRKPFINKDPQFNDVDNIQKIIISISGAIARTLGRKNKYSDAFEEIYSEYTSSLLTIDSGEEDAEE